MIITALILGVAGSLHCLGMCSPLMMAVTNIRPRAVLNRFVYNAGRIFSYSVLGAVVASVGFVIPFARMQNMLSVIIGIVLLVIGISGIASVQVPVITPALQKLNALLKVAFGKFIQRKSMISTLMLGMLNGLLPCGLSFLALSYCLTLQGPVDGFSFMFWFGIGTLPIMLGATAMLQWISARIHLSYQKLTTALMLTSGILLIARVFLFHEMPASGHDVMEIILCVQPK